jgi:hypothetical protein
MIKIINSLEKEKNACLFFILEKKSDLKKINIFNISEKIINNLEKKFEEKKDKKNEDKSFCQEFFI